MILLFAAQAEAKPRVAVVRADDALIGAIESAVEKSGEAEVVAKEVFDEAAERLGYSGGSTEELVAVARELGLSAMLEATVAKRGGNVQVTVSVRTGSKADTVASFRARAKRNRLPALIQGGLWKKIGASVRASVLLRKEPRVIGLGKLTGPRAPALVKSLSSELARADVNVVVADEAIVWFEGRIEQRKKRLFAVVTIAGGRERSEVTVTGKDPGALAVALVPALRKALDATSTAPPPPLAPPTPPVTSSPPAEPLAAAVEAPIERKQRSRSESAIELGVGIQVLNRTLRYNDDLFGALRPYDAVAPTPEVRIIWYPGAHFIRGIGAHFGLELNGDYVFNHASEREGGAKFPTRAFTFGAAVRGRLPLGAHELGLSAGYGQQAFEIEADDAGNDPGLPGVKYSFLRVGLDARIELVESFHLGARGAWRQVLSAGEIQSDAWFPRAKLGAADVEAIVGWEVVTHFELQLAFQMRRYFFSFNPEPGDAKVAGGAVDQYLGGTFRTAFVW